MDFTFTNGATRIKMKVVDGSNTKTYLIRKRDLDIYYEGNNVVIFWNATGSGKFMNQWEINYSDVSSPSVSSAEDLADQLQTWADEVDEGNADDWYNERDMRTDFVPIVDEDNVTAQKTYSPLMDMEGFYYFVAQCIGSDDSSSGGVAFKMFVTGDPDASAPTDGSDPDAEYWNEITSDVFSSTPVEVGAGGSAEAAIARQYTPRQWAKVVVQYTPTSDTNSVKILFKKF